MCSAKNVSLMYVGACFDVGFGTIVTNKLADGRVIELSLVDPYRAMQTTGSLTLKL